jgi:gas vesicle protein
MTSDDEIDVEMFDTPRRGSSKLIPFALGAIIGGAIGAALGMLYAPAEGADLRREMSDKLDGVMDGAKDIIRGAKSTAEKLFSDGMESIDSFEEEVHSVAAKMRERADDILEEADRAITEARRRSMKHTSSEQSSNWEDDDGIEA